MKNRHVCCATGDKINIDFRLNDAFPGDVVRGNSRRIYLNVEGGSAVLIILTSLRTESVLLV